MVKSKLTPQTDSKLEVLEHHAENMPQFFFHQMLVKSVCKFFQGPCLKNCIYAKIFIFNVLKCKIIVTDWQK